MKTLRRVLSAAAALALLLCGCSSIDLARYPRVSDPPPEFPAQNLTLYLPADADEFLLDAMHQLADRVETLSGGSVSLTISDGSGAEDAELRVLTTANLIAADKRMQFLSFPYLFANRETFLAVCGSEDGPVRTDRGLQKSLGGEILGVLYGGSLGYICRSRLYPEIGLTGGELGLLPDGWYGREAHLSFSETAARDVSFGNSGRLQELMEEGKIKYAEYRRDAGSGEELPSNAKYYEDTSHRFLAFWLVLRENTVDAQVWDLLSQSVSYIVGEQDSRRVIAEQDALDSLSGSVQIHTGDFEPLFFSARSYYRSDPEAAGIPAEIWAQLDSL